MSKELLADVGIDYKKYLVNTGDGLELQRKLLHKLAKEKYDFMCPAKIIHDKSKCDNVQCSRIIWEHVVAMCA